MYPYSGIVFAPYGYVLLGLVQIGLKGEPYNPVSALQACLVTLVYQSFWFLFTGHNPDRFSKSREKIIKESRSIYLPAQVS